jgi:hypothetical protein
MEPRLTERTEQAQATAVINDFCKFAFAIGAHPRSPREALGELRGFARNSPRIGLVVNKGSVQAGDLGSGNTWGDAWANFQTLVNPWVVEQSKLTLLGKLQTTRAPFNTLITSTPGIAADFIGAGAAFPAVSGSITATTKLTPTKLAVFVIVADELFRLWAPGSRENINALLTRGLIRGADSRFIDPDSAASANVRPTSVLSGVSPLGDFTNSAAGALADLQTLLAAHITAGSDLERLAICMHPSTCLALSILQFSGGSYAFPGLGPTGGVILNNVPVFTSVSCIRSGSPSEKIVAAIDGEKIALADDGEGTLEASTVASVAQSDAPAGSSTAQTAENWTSLFQTGSVAFKLVRAINWQKIDSTAAARGGRRRARLLGRTRGGLPRDAASEVLEAQDGQRPELPAAGTAAQGKGGAARDLDGRDQGRGEPRLRSVHRRLRRQVPQGRRVPGQGSRRVARLL